MSSCSPSLCELQQEREVATVRMPAMGRQNTVAYVPGAGTVLECKR